MSSACSAGSVDGGDADATMPEGMEHGPKGATVCNADNEQVLPGQGNGNATVTVTRDGLPSMLHKRNNEIPAAAMQLAATDHHTHDESL